MPCRQQSGLHKNAPQLLVDLRQAEQQRRRALLRAVCSIEETGVSIPTLVLHSTERERIVVDFVVAIVDAIAYNLEESLGNLLAGFAVFIHAPQQPDRIPNEQLQQLVLAYTNMTFE